MQASTLLVYPKDAASTRLCMPTARASTKEIWKMSAAELGGKRRYQTDFEIYDERAADHQNIVLDIFVGIEPLLKS